ncbi:hypothetical protein DY000_02020462 [Brassica cretica]|uniref:DUF1204 domain-containing protein n=1 Tax=Brassica cretica TaxID=69181 RepID=A0ABQ7EJN6_BRACR|nr:hypothetical protein DY000_02020462 [Brassica cretica]
MSSSQNDKKNSDAEMVEASSQAPESTPSDNAPACVAGFLSFREKMARRKTEKEPIHFCAAPPSSSAPVVTPTVDPVVQAPQDAGEQSGTGILCVSDASAQPSGSSTTPIVVDDKEKVTELMPAPPTRKEIVLALRAPSATPAVPVRSRKRRCTKGNDGEPSHLEGLSLASGLRGKFVSLIDGMINDCSSEASRLARELTETHGKLSELESMMKTVEDSHSAKVSKLEVQIGELDRKLGKTVSFLIKEKKARKTKSSKVRRLQRLIENGEESTNRGVEEAKGVLSVEFQACLTRITDFLSSLECAEEARLSACKEDLAAVGGSFELILADLKSECILPTSLEVPEGQDPLVGEGGNGAAPILDEAMGEGECLLWPFMAMFMFWDWPLVALNPCRFTAFYEWMISLRLWQDLGLLLVLGGVTTNSTYVSCYCFDLIPYRFKVRDRFSAYTTCPVGIEHLSKDNF